MGSPKKKRNRRAGHAHAAKLGMAPGTLHYVGPERQEAVALSALSYTQEKLTELDHLSVAQALELSQQDGVCWINVSGIHDIAYIQEMGKAFNIHSLVLEDILNTGGRPKIEEFEGHLFILIKMLRYADEHLVIEQVSLIVGERYIISFQEVEGDVLDPVRKRIQDEKSRIRRMGADYLMMTLLDSIIDHYYLVIEKFNDWLEDLEDEVVKYPTADTLQRLSDVRQELIQVRRAVMPVRDFMSTFRQFELRQITSEVVPFLRDTYDHTLQVIDAVNALRDVMSSLFEMYLSNMSHRMNEVMKILTIIGTLFIPLTFVAGIYGMNFKYMPELDWPYSYPIAMGLMFIIGGGILHYFKRKGWL
jgi:magnesium transporter